MADVTSTGLWRINQVSRDSPALITCLITSVPTVLTLVVSQGDRCLYAARSPPNCQLVIGWVGVFVALEGFGVWVGVWVGCGWWRVEMEW